MATIATTETKTDASQSLESVPHWIGGKAVRGTVEIVCRRFSIRPRGKSTRRVPLDSTAELEQAVAAATRRVPGMVKPCRRCAGARVLFRFRDLLEKNTDRLAAVITAEHGKVLGRRPRRSHARPRGRRVRLRHPASAEGRVHRAGRHRHRQLVAAPAAGRGAPASRRSTSRRWCRCGCCRSRSPAATASS